MADVEFEGERFETAERIGLMPMMRFAKVAKAGVDSDDMAGLAALYDLLEQCISDRQVKTDKDGKPIGPTEWQRFQDHADKVRADGEQLMKVVAEVFEVLSERPTSRPSDSSVGPSTTGPSSTGDSSLRLVRDYEAKGRPDIALQIMRANQAS